MKSKLLPFIAIFFLSVSYSFSQTKTLVLPKPTPKPPPGNIKMLSGYVHKQGQGIDTRVGKIFKENGLKIEYDIGGLAGNYALGAYTNKKEKVIWFKIQETNGYEVLLAYLKDGSIYATFPEDDANFIADIKTNEDLADFLIMIMTYGSTNELKVKKKNR